MEVKVHGVSMEMDDQAARTALKSLVIDTGSPSIERVEYAKSWML